MEYCSYFIKDKALFGSYPTQESIPILENEGVRHFIDLTCEGESKIIKYQTNYNYINYPIIDRKVPYNWRSFARFILHLSSIIKQLDSEKNEKLYIHCRGGHGRSGVVVACILCHLFNKTPEEAIQLTTNYHSNRSIMREKWRLMGSPQTRIQKIFVHRFFSPLYIYRAYKQHHTTGFSNFSLHSVDINGMGIFPTSEAAFQAHKDPENQEYIIKQLNAKSPSISKSFGSKCNLRKDWHTQKINIMYNILKLKLSQHDDIREKLLNTGLRPIIDHGMDHFWCNGSNGDGENMYGKLLTTIRNRFYQQF